MPSTQYPTIQSAVNAANPGDTIILQAGVTFTESVVLKYKTGSTYITIQSSALSSLPPDGQRVSPSHAQFMPKIVPPSGGGSAVLTEITANGPSHHYRLLGIEMAQTNSSQLIYSMVSLGSSDSDQNTLAKVAHHFIIDRCYIHGHVDGELRRGIALNSEYTDIVNSYISEVHQVEDDSQAIGGWNGPGQYLIENNYLEAASENILFGGSDPSISNLVPSDIVIRHNLVTKKLSWYSRTPPWKVKNILELKNARRVNIVENIFENNWAHAQSGFGILFTVRNQSGTAPWSTIEDVTFNYNTVRNTPSSISVLAQDYKFPSQNVKNLSINYNLISSISTLPLNPDANNGRCVQVLGGGSFGTQNLTLNHNTCVGFGSYPAFIYGDSDSSIKVTGLDVKNNIAMGLNAGTDATISGNAQPSGTPSLNAMTANTWTLQKNILMLPSGSSTYPNSSPNINYYVSNSSSVGFVNFASGNYALSSTSPYRNLGTDSTDPGANIQYLDQIKPCIESGNWSSCGSSPSTQTPYPGPGAPSLPATIEVEKFDTGGQNIAYNDTFGSTGSGAYRTSPVEGVDILGYSNASNGFAVMEAAAGEWLEYTINVPSPGLYNFKTKYASGYTQPNSQGKFKIEVCEPAPNNGITNCVSSGDITVNSTGGWNTFQTVTRLFSLPSAGTRILRLTMVANAPGDGTPCNCVVANFDSIAISKGRTLFDYDGDGKADLSVARPSATPPEWRISQSTAGNAIIPYGLSGDIIAPADYDGDGKTDIAVYRPSDFKWYIRRSSDLVVTVQQFGASGDIPVPQDYDGDGKDDIAIYRPSSGQWWIQRSTLGTIAFTFGNSTDKPVQGDYTGDGKADVAVWRPSTGEWYILRSEDYSYYSFPFGLNGDTPVMGDFDGDGKYDAAIFRPSTSTWYLQRSTAGLATLGYGTSGDKLVPADYDGDGKSDVALFRPSTLEWFLVPTTTQIPATSTYGVQSTDIPTPSAYIH
ncbi:MAG: FG-GAP-like repeat-containing protein [Pyrinomonadaceae bacterium]